MRKLTLLAILPFTSTAILASQDPKNKTVLPGAEHYLPGIVAKYYSTAKTLELNETLLKTYNSSSMLAKMNKFLNECKLSTKKINLIKELAKKETLHETRATKLFQDYMEQMISEFSVKETALEEAVKKQLLSKKK